MKKITFNVMGMRCGGCVNSIQGSVGKLQGVAEVKVHLSEGNVDVLFDSDQITVEEIKTTIENKGYHVE
ncbi:copper chaperone [Ureibacillus xyleni]|uniref:Copper chaperone CopZ n=1 Tax=Ureibacillus xyleni TaxID=614648 RepID=A0A285SER3_9BACL|nr:copper ion binding protein [Ureibacillus xyleni]SOC06412.1 copper chaperone [Ureibacillus xyleni]